MCVVSSCWFQLNFLVTVLRSLCTSLVVHAQCASTFHIAGLNFRSHLSNQSANLLKSCWSDSASSRLCQDVIQPVAEVTSRRRLRSASSSALLWCQQHVVHRLVTEPLRLLDHAHGTVYLSSSPTARQLSPSRNISRLIYLVYLFRARFDCVKRPCSSLGSLRRSNFVTLHYITLHCISIAVQILVSLANIVMLFFVQSGKSCTNML